MTISPPPDGSLSQLAVWIITTLISVILTGGAFFYGYWKSTQELISGLQATIVQKVEVQRKECDALLESQRDRWSKVVDTVRDECDKTQRRNDEMFAKFLQMQQVNNDNILASLEKISEGQSKIAERLSR